MAGAIAVFTRRGALGLAQRDPRTEETGNRSAGRLSSNRKGLNPAPDIRRQLLPVLPENPREALGADHPAAIELLLHLLQGPALSPSVRAENGRLPVTRRVLLEEGPDGRGEGPSPHRRPDDQPIVSLRIDGHGLELGLGFGLLHLFQQAYIDVAMGESGEVPPAAPMEYWKAKLRNCEGHSRADDWFQGYAAGASFAINQVACPNRVASSGMGGYPPETHGQHGQFCPADCP